MGMVAYYARVGVDEAAALKADPDRYWRIGEMSWDLTQAVEPGASECLYIDKDWQVLSWLCSPLGQAEERNQAASFGAMDRMDRGEFTGDGAFEKAQAREAEALGFPRVDVRTLPEDPVLKAIQGRRAGDDGPTVADLGAAAAVFGPEEVRSLADALNSLDEGWLRDRFDIAEMETLGLPADCEETEFDGFFLPQLERLRALYNRAAAAGQHVVVVIS